MIKDDGGFVYPLHPNHGITRRDYYAGLAMQGLLAKGIDYYTGCDPENVENELPMRAYGIADAMIAEGKKD
jgi:hypothetical protein